MPKYFLFEQPYDVIEPLIVSRDRRTTMRLPSVAALQVDDRALFVREEPVKSVLPFVSKVNSINRDTGMVTLQLDAMYNAAVLFGEVSMVNRQMGEGPYRSFINAMQGVRMEERALLEHINRYILARGYYFDEETLFNYHISLKTRPFAILAGLSGTGKSKLSRLYAEALGRREQHFRLAVRPNWNDDRYLLGYLNTITGEYMTEPSLDFILRACNDPDNLYFLCLDEMNLAHVEYYFSQFLSALEEDDPRERTIPLLSASARKTLEEAGKRLTVPEKLVLPANLLFTGTINVDETTQSISDKVIDRANTLEFFSVDLAKLPTPQPLPDQLVISAYTWQSYRAQEPDTSYRAQIIALNEILQKIEMGLGYRVVHEIEMYLAHSRGLLAPDVAFDLQVKQRILPRVRGTAVIDAALIELQAFLKAQGLARSLKRLQEMKQRLERDGYTSFWR